MVSLDLFQSGDVYLDYPFEEVKFRYEKKTGKVFGRFYGGAEKEITPSSKLYHEAISSGEVICREDYYSD